MSTLKSMFDVNLKTQGQNLLSTFKKVGLNTSSDNKRGLIIPAIDCYC